MKLFLKSIMIEEGIMPEVQNYLKSKINQTKAELNNKQQIKINKSNQVNSNKIVNQVPIDNKNNIDNTINVRKGI